ncbi:hypothetical protein EDD21DRAFT_358097 [Dissophora ornata]|nr:hypothetical protein EDD21DRAFT_358097 [Dissophora ornata]
MAWFRMLESIDPPLSSLFLSVFPSVSHFFFFLVLSPCQTAIPFSTSDIPTFLYPTPIPGGHKKSSTSPLVTSTAIFPSVGRRLAQLASTSLLDNIGTSRLYMGAFINKRLLSPPLLSEQSLVSSLSVSATSFKSRSTDPLHSSD